jgi:hypothetical protein
MKGESCLLGLLDSPRPASKQLNTTTHTLPLDITVD